MKKRLLCLVLTAMFLLSLMPTTFANGDIKVYIDGAPVTFDVPAQIVNDRTMVPLRAIFERLGAQVFWNETTRSVLARRGSDTVECTIGVHTIYVNGAPKCMDVSPIIVEGRTLVPVRFVAEAFGYEVEWNEKERAVYISTQRPVGEVDGTLEEAVKNREWEDVELIWYLPKTPQEGDAEVFAAANRIIGEKLGGLKVNFIPIDGVMYSEKIHAKIGLSEEFDICYTSYWMNDYKRNAENDAFVTLDDYQGNNLLQNYAPDLYEMIPQKVWDGTKVNGNIYGVPNYQIMASGKSFWFDKELVEKYNFDVSKIEKATTWEEKRIYLEEFFELVKKNDPDRVPTETNELWDMVALCHGFTNSEMKGVSYDMNVPEGTYINEYATQEFEDFVYMAKDWYEKGYVRSDIGYHATSEEDLKAGRYASGWCTTKVGMESTLSQIYGREVFVVKMTPDVITTEACIATMNAVSSTSKHPAAAVSLLNLVNTDKELYNLLVYGLEGVHWEKAPELGENYITVCTGAEEKYSMYDWMIGCVFNGYLQEGQEADVWEKMIEMNEQAMDDPLLGFFLDWDMLDVPSEIYRAHSRYLGRLECGVGEDLGGDLSNLRSELEEYGINQILAEMNRQLREFLGE